MFATRGLNSPWRLRGAVALVAGAMLLVELMATRLFSVLFFYHFSFFAVSLAMSGLALGGLLVSRANVRDLSVEALANRCATLALAFSTCVLLALLQVSLAPAPDEQLSLGRVALHAMVFLPGLVAAGAFLAVAFAHRESWIGSLYAADLLAAAAACVAAIALMRSVQGPAMLLCPGLLSATAAAVLRPPSRARRAAAVVLALACCAGLAASWATGGRFLALQLDSPPMFERWNEHSRVVAYPVGPPEHESDRMLLIDRSAVTYMPRVPASRLKGKFDIELDWGNSSRYIAYRLGRSIDSAAVIGVGGGEDLGPPLAHGVTRIDGYEINGILVDLLRRRWSDFNALASRPEIHLIHSEARVGIARSTRRYDLIQASLIDTWAATASGGFVLSESGLYTIEGWRTFLRALSDRGMLTMTRWYLPAAPAEIERLVALAVAALADAGIAEPAAHLIVVGDQLSADQTLMMATLVLSKRAFSEEELRRARQIAAADELPPLLVPGERPADPVLARLLDPRLRDRAIAESPFDISPPTDDRPYFFLQLRPRQVPSLFGKRLGAITEITFNGVRVMTLLAGIALLLVIAVGLLAAASSPGSARPSRATTVANRWLVLYFAAIGVGYMLVQLGLHQRLILLLGRPTYVLSVVLFSMLLGTGAGAAVSTRVAGPGAMRKAWLGIIIMLAAVYVAWPFALADLESMTSPAARALCSGALVAVIGFALGFPFPFGVRLVAPLGEWTVQRMWAVNGAAAIAGCALAAILGLILGSRMNLFAGLLCYVLMSIAGVAALRHLPGMRARGQGPAKAAEAVETMAGAGSPVA